MAMGLALMAAGSAAAQGLHIVRGVVASVSASSVTITDRDGKPAGVRCPHLTAETTCALFGTPARPATCTSLRPQLEMCGDSADAAMATLVRWERLTAPRAK